MRISVECLLCGKTITVDIDSNEMDKSLAELLKGKAYPIAVINDDIVEVFGFVCDDCFQKLKNSKFYFRGNNKYLKKYNKNTYK